MLVGLVRVLIGRVLDHDEALFALNERRRSGGTRAVRVRSVEVEYWEVLAGYGPGEGRTWRQGRERGDTIDVCQSLLLLLEEELLLLQLCMLLLRRAKRVA